jgi:hypothetical protein
LRIMSIASNVPNNGYCNHQFEDVVENEAK